MGNFTTVYSPEYAGGAQFYPSCEYNRGSEQKSGWKFWKKAKELPERLKWSHWPSCEFWVGEECRTDDGVYVGLGSKAKTITGGPYVPSDDVLVVVSGGKIVAIEPNQYQNEALNDEMQETWYQELCLKYFGTKRPVWHG